MTKGILCTLALMLSCTQPVFAKQTKSSRSRRKGSLKNRTSSSKQSPRKTSSTRVQYLYTKPDTNLIEEVWNSKWGGFYLALIIGLVIWFILRWVRRQRTKQKQETIRQKITSVQRKNQSKSSTTSQKQSEKENLKSDKFGESSTLGISTKAKGILQKWHRDFKTLLEELLWKPIHFTREAVKRFAIKKSIQFRGKMATVSNFVFFLPIQREVKFLGTKQGPAGSTKSESQSIEVELTQIEHETSSTQDDVDNSISKRLRDRLIPPPEDILDKCNTLLTNAPVDVKRDIGDETDVIKNPLPYADAPETIELANARLIEKLQNAVAQKKKLLVSTDQNEQPASQLSDKKEKVNTNSQSPTRKSARIPVSIINGTEEVVNGSGTISRALVGGLHNEGNTCFVNAIVQILSSLDSFEAFLDKMYSAQLVILSYQYTAHPKQQSQVASSLRKLTHLLNTTHVIPEVYSAREVAETLDSALWAKKEPGDAEEWLTLLMNKLQAEYTSLFSRHESSKHDLAQRIGPQLYVPFDGEMVSRKVCMACGETNVQKEMVSKLQLSLGETLDSSVSLESLLDGYTAATPLHQVECNRCSLLAHLLASGKNNGSTEQMRYARDKLRKGDIKDEDLSKPCKRVLTDKTSHCNFGDTPARVLAIHLNRSVFDKNTKRVKKNATKLEFPEVLDISKYVSDVAMKPLVAGENVMLPVQETKPSATVTLNDVSSSKPLHKADVLLESDESTTETGGTMVSRDSSLATSWTSSGVSPIEPNWNIIFPDSPTEEESNETRSEDTKFKYRLKGFIVHQGNHEDGHYWCYRTDRSGNWYKINDDEVVISDKELSQLCAEQSDGVVVLFYEQVDEAQLRVRRLRSELKQLAVESTNIASRLGYVISRSELAEDKSQQRPTVVVLEEKKLASPKSKITGKKNKG